MQSSQPELAALVDQPLRFSIKQEDFQRAFDVARLAGEYARIEVSVHPSGLTLRTDAQGLSCASRCKIGNVRGPTIPLAVTMVRAPLEELAAKKSNWGLLECNVTAKQLSDNKTSSWSTVWHFEYGQTFAMCSAEPIETPEAFTDLARPSEFDATRMAQTLRWVKPFTDPENKKTQFTTVSVGQAGGYGITPSAGRSISSADIPENMFHVSSGHINDLAHALARLLKPAVLSIDDENVFFRDADTWCKLRRGRASASFPLLKLAGSEPAIAVHSGQLEEALWRVGSQAKRKETIRIQAGPSVGPFLLLSAAVEGGTARCRLPLPDAPAADVDVLASITSLGKMIAPSVASDAKLIFLPGAVICRQTLDELTLTTLLNARPFTA